MNKVFEIINRIIVNDPIALLIIIFLIGLAISIHMDFNKINKGYIPLNWFSFFSHHIYNQQSVS